MKYFVSRQAYWPDGDLVVEVSEGGIEYANPDMLVKQYPKLGEGREFVHPMDALRAAFAVRNKWIEDSGEEVRVEMGCTHGFTMPFEEHPTDDQLIKLAEKIIEKTPKCDHCGEPMFDEQLEYEHGNFCSERCAEHEYDDMYEDDWDEIYAEQQHNYYRNLGV